jgi:AcrR family transcriptional regulator
VSRPRSHDLDDLLDVAERIATEAGPAGLTLRGLAAMAGVSNGSIYHAFLSKDELLARVWLRAVQRFLRAQSGQVDAALAGEGTAVDAVVRAALAPVDFAARYPTAARLFFLRRREQLFGPDLPESLAAQLESAQAEFTATLVRLADAMWQRHDRAALSAIAACVVDLPGGMLRRQLESTEGLQEPTGPRIAAAARAILALPLPAPAAKARTPRTSRKEHRS